MPLKINGKKVKKIIVNNKSVDKILLDNEIRFIGKKELKVINDWRYEVPPGGFSTFDSSSWKCSYFYDRNNLGSDHKVRFSYIECWNYDGMQSIGSSVYENVRNLPQSILKSYNNINGTNFTSISNVTIDSVTFGMGEYGDMYGGELHINPRTTMDFNSYNLTDFGIVQSVNSMGSLVASLPYNANGYYNEYGQRKFTIKDLNYPVPTANQFLYFQTAEYQPDGTLVTSASPDGTYSGRYTRLNLDSIVFTFNVS